MADALVVAAGAGMGVDSGLPDFRGTPGFWKAYPARGRARLDFAEIANPRHFEPAPALARGFYGTHQFRRREDVAVPRLQQRWLVGRAQDGAARNRARRP